MQSMIPNNRTFKSNQCGSVLIVSLVILLVMTMLGLAAAGSANMELRMAGNNERINTTLQAAESAVEATINNISLLGQALNSAGPINQTIRLDSAYDAASQPVASEAEISYVGQGSMDGFSLGINQNNFVAHNFEVIGRGSMQGNVSSVTSQGVFRVAPSGS
jgi:type IV pilus assembly protein PilX